MGFKEVQSLNCDEAVALGGVNKKTGKSNPKQVEGYYLGNRMVPSKKSSTGFARLHVFQTASGNLGVWGKTDLDQKLASVGIGSMVRATFTGMIPTGKGDMYNYKVEHDADNTIEVALPSETSTNEEDSYETAAEQYEEETEEEEELADEAPLERPSRPRVAKEAPNGASTARSKELLAKARAKLIS